MAAEQARSRAAKGLIYAAGDPEDAGISFEHHCRACLLGHLSESLNCAVETMES